MRGLANTSSPVLLDQEENGGEMNKLDLKHIIWKYKQFSLIQTQCNTRVLYCGIIYGG